MSSGGSRVSIPSSVRKMIHNIKEITGNHSEEEIYAMLKECSMDPNETAQKLLLQDTFHEVKRKRDRRKENMIKESAESRWKPGMQGRGGRGGRGNYSSRYIPDAVAGRNSASGKESRTSKISEDDVALSTMPTDTKNKEVSSVVSSSTVITDGSTPIASDSTSVVRARHLFVGGGVKQSEGTATAAISKPETPPSLTPSVEANKNPTIEIGTERKLTAVTASLEVGRSFVQGKTPNKSQGVGKNQIPESSQPAPSTHGGSSGSRPSSNYSSRSQQVIGPQKVGPNKEWKPKTTNPSMPQGSGMVISSEVPEVTVEAGIISQPAPKALDSTEATSELEKKLDLSHISDGQNVIIPNHLHVPEAEKLGFCFGSFDASFGLNTSYASGPESEKSPLSETSEVIEGSVEEQSSSNQVGLANSGDEDNTDHHPSSSHVPETLSSSEGDAPSTVVPEYNESKQETALLPGVHQHSAGHTSPNYNFGFIPPIIGSQLAPSENTESQARDISRLPSFVVQQPLDPTSYYGQFYRPGADSDGRISPFHSPAVATKYNGTLLSPQASQSSQEGGSSLLLSTAGPTPIVTQAGGVMQSSIAVSQQPLPVFRQPHLPHFHPNYIPYAHYYSQFYVPPPATIHQFLSNGTFPQQPQAGNVYPAPPPLATTKYSFSQYKPGTNTGNPTHIGVPGSYGPYSSSLPAAGGYNPTSAGNGTSHEDLTSSQFKESNNVYIAGQQSEGSGVWIAAQGRDLSGLPSSSFYNLPQGGQVAAFTPAQAGHHGTFAGIYHHPAAQPVTAAAAVHPLLQQSQTMAGPVDMVGPTASVYQQPQSAQINWPANY